MSTSVDAFRDRLERTHKQRDDALTHVVSCRVLWCRVPWCGGVSCDVVWCGVMCAMHGVVWCGLPLLGVV